jgi:hypothetical protein
MNAAGVSASSLPAGQARARPQYALRHAALDLGALDDSVPTARLHARLVPIGWGHASLAPDGELVVSELLGWRRP